MKNFLEELYNSDISNEKFHDRKFLIDDSSFVLYGITNSGKTKLVKNYLSTLRKSTYLYIDCSDIRIDFQELNKELAPFCEENTILTLVLDNYNEQIRLFNITQLILISQKPLHIAGVERRVLYPLDYEEFLAFEIKHDSTALNHFFKLGAFAHIHKISADERALFIQNMLRLSLSDLEFEILCFCSNFTAQKLSAYTIYERLKQYRKVSKDKLYESFHELIAKGYLHKVPKYEHAKAINKLYLCDISLKYALSIHKNFAKVFENAVYLELLKSDQEVFYSEDIDFYLPQTNSVLLCMPFANERLLFKRVEKIEAFLFQNSIKQINAITMSIEGSMLHPQCEVRLTPFDIWALSD